MRAGFRLAAVAAALGCAAPAADPDAGAAGPWEADAQAFEAADARSPPRRGGVVFTGSSSIRLWDLEGSFPGRGYLNRGFGGSHFSDCAALAPRIVLPYEPEMVVIYAGDNDIAAGKSPETVLGDARAFAGAVHAGLPGARIVFISIKPSLARWNFWPLMRRANQLLAEWTGGDPRLGFVDVATPMLGPDGQPRPELFAADGLHLGAAGYDLWRAQLQRTLDAASFRVPAGEAAGERKVSRTAGWFGAGKPLRSRGSDMKERPVAGRA
jgi:lysophospholipase L1-like esterase